MMMLTLALLLAPQDEKLPKAKDIAALIGRDHLSQEMRAFRKIVGRDCEASYFEDCFYHIWKDRGIDLSFDDRNACQAVFFYAEKADDHRQYKGELPGALSFEHTRADVEKLLGAPDKSGGDGVISYWCSWHELGISVTYVSKDTKDMENKIHHVTLTAPKKD